VLDELVEPGVEVRLDGVLVKVLLQRLRVAVEGGGGECSGERAVVRWW